MSVSKAEHCVPEASDLATRSIAHKAVDMGLLEAGQQDWLAKAPEDLACTCTMQVSLIEMHVADHSLWPLPVRCDELGDNCSFTAK